MRRLVIAVPVGVVEVLVVDDGDRTTVDVRHHESGIWQPLALAGGRMREEID